MDVIDHLTTSPTLAPLQCIDMHTCGELTRILVSAASYPRLTGTLLEQRAQALAHHDHIRRRILLEPRGHADAYGAILRPDTELTGSGAAHIGVLFLTNEGYSTMCGHATVALGRFLFDTRDTAVFPRRGEVVVDPATRTARIDLHAPCGVVEVTVPVTPDGQRSDPSRPVSFLNVPSFVTGVDVAVSIPEELRWPELEGRVSVTADFSYGGAFFCFVPAAELGFRKGLREMDFEATHRAIRALRAAVNGNPALAYLTQHPDHDDLNSVYCFILVDRELGVPSPDAVGAETGYCFFGHEQIDRSPTGSAVTARVALAHVKGQRAVGDKWTYHSLVSNAYGGKGGFDGVIRRVFEDKGTGSGEWPVTQVEVSGFASYIGTSTYVVEKEDVLGDGGFLFERLGSA